MYIKNYSIFRESFIEKYASSGICSADKIAWVAYQHASSDLFKFMDINQYLSKVLNNEKLADTPNINIAELYKNSIDLIYSDDDKDKDKVKFSSLYILSLYKLLLEGKKISDIDELTDLHVIHLINIHEEILKKRESKYNDIFKDAIKLKAVKFYNYMLLSRENENPREFIEKDLYKVELYPSTYISKGDGGSNLVFDYNKEFNKGTQPKTRQELYNQYFNSRKSTSNVNVIQRDAAKAREVLNVYGNKQHEQAPANKADIRPEIVKAKEEEQKAQDKLERKEDGGKVVMDGSQAVNKLINTISIGGGAAKNIAQLIN